MWGMCEMISADEVCDKVCMLLQYQVAELACRGHVGKVLRNWGRVTWKWWGATGVAAA